MDYDICIFTFLSWVLNVIFLLMFLPSYNWDKESNMWFGVFIDETWGIKWSLIESTMTLLVFTLLFLFPSFGSSPSSFGISSSTKPYKSFSSKMSITLYFHAWKLWAPSSFSSSLVLEVIFPSKLKMIYQKWNI